MIELQPIQLQVLAVLLFTIGLATVLSRRGSGCSWRRRG